MDNLDQSIISWVIKTVGFVTKGGPEDTPEGGKMSWQEWKLKRYAERRTAERRARYANNSSGGHTVGDYPGHPFRGNQYQKALTEILKGDLPGHTFRGNQWTSLGGKADALSGAVQKLSLSSTPEEIRSLARVHQGLAFQHVNVVSQHEEMPYLTTPQEIGAEAHQDLTNSSSIAQGVHDEAAEAHQHAAAELNHVAEMIESGRSQGSLRLAMATAKGASLLAADASREGDKTALPHPVGDPEFRDHEAKMDAEMEAEYQAKFGKSVDFTKGDLPGHPFRGNQYATGQELSDKATNLRNTVERGIDPYSANQYSVTSFHNDIADRHQNLAADHREAAEALQQLQSQVANEGNVALTEHLTREIGSHREAAAIHQLAADNHDKVIDAAINPRGADWSQQADAAADATRAADRASAKAAIVERQRAMMPTLKSISFTKGDYPGHPFRGNQYSHGEAAAALRDLAKSARAANAKSRLKTDVLGISGARSDKTGNYNRSVPTYSTPRYLQSQTENAKEHNEYIASHAEALAKRIESDTSKPVEQHIADLQDAVSGLRSQGQFHTSVDNYDTGGNYYRSANAGQGIVDHLSGMKSEAPASEPDEPQYAGGTTSEIAAGLQEGIRSGRISTPMDMDNYLYESGFDGDPTELF